MSQLITPNPNIPCRPGWCLAYVNEAFGVRKVYGTATAAWLASPTQHRDRNFPEGLWVPVWFSLANEPAGHVALLAPDGSVYSTSDPSTTPHHHPSLAHLIGYYAYYGMPLTYLGWTEDVEGTPVIAPDMALSNLASIIITELQEAGVALEHEDKVFIQELVNGMGDRIILDNRAHAKHYAAQVVDVVTGKSEEIKVFAQHVVNPRIDQVIDEVRADG